MPPLLFFPPILFAAISLALGTVPGTPSRLHEYLLHELSNVTQQPVELSIVFSHFINFSFCKQRPVVEPTPNLQLEGEQGIEAGLLAPQCGLLYVRGGWPCSCWGSRALKSEELMAYATVPLWLMKTELNSWKLNPIIWVTGSLLWWLH